MAALASKDVVDGFQQEENDLESGASSTDEDGLDFDEEVGLDSDQGKCDIFYPVKDYSGLSKMILRCKKLCMHVVDRQKAFWACE